MTYKAVFMTQDEIEKELNQHAEKGWRLAGIAGVNGTKVLLILRQKVKAQKGSKKTLTAA
jgi:hypothetical protein